MKSPLLTHAGAVAAEGIDAGVPAHYGDPYGEQRALASAAGFVDRSNRGVLRITGADRLTWLHSLTTQDTEHLAPGATAQALVLSPQGHVEHHLTLTDDGAAVWLHVEPGTAAELAGFLASMRFLLRVDPADVTGGFAVLTLMGPGVGEPPEAATAAMREPFGTDLIVARDRLPDLIADLERRGMVPAGMLAYEALRIAAHRPRLGADTDHRTIPHEVGWIGTAVHLDKGCYRGQETVARVHNLGHPPRRLVFLHLDGSEDRLPAHGDLITESGAGGRPPMPPAEAPRGTAPGGDGVAVGFVGSSARHYELGPIALGLIKRTVPAGAPLRAGGLPAAQEVVVPPDAGANVKVTLKRPRGALVPPRD